jgi:hypothetical protein
MSFLSGLSAVFGAALAPLAADGVLHSTTLADTGAGGVAASFVDCPVKVLVESLSDADRIGLPRDAVRLTVLRAGLAVPVALDDSLTVGSETFRVTGVDRDPAGASFVLVGVPA